jgi:hypothetical protein
MRISKKWRIWGSGLVGGIVHGAASAGSAQMALATASGIGIDVKPLDFKSLGAVLISASLFSMFAFLRQSPIPTPSNDTDFITKPVAVKVVLP